MHAGIGHDLDAPGHIHIPQTIGTDDGNIMVTGQPHELLLAKTTFISHFSKTCSQDNGIMDASISHLLHYRQYGIRGHHDVGQVDRFTNISELGNSRSTMYGG